MRARQKLISAASRLFHAKGYNNTSVQDILDASSVFRNNFYYHFDGKEQLGFEVLGRKMGWWYGYVVKPSLDNHELRPSERVNVLLRLYTMMWKTLPSIGMVLLDPRGTRRKYIRGGRCPAIIDQPHATRVRTFN